MTVGLLGGAERSSEDWRMSRSACDEGHWQCYSPMQVKQTPCHQCSTA